MADVFHIINRFRALLAEREERAQAEVLRAYEAAWRAIAEALADLTSRVEASPDEGASRAFRIERRRLLELERQVVEAILEVGRVAADVTEREQAALVTAAERHAAALTRAQRGGRGAAEVAVNFDHLPADVMQNIVGAATDGSPVRESFEGLARDLGLETGERIKQALVRGAALGQNPTEIARRVRREADAKGDNPMRQPQVARRLNQTVRTESYRALREATRASYQASGVVSLWRWVAALSPSTCVICWAQHGKTFPLSVPMHSHIACRCTQVPVLDTNESFETGEEKFSKLEPGFQKQILGEKAFGYYRRGELSLSSVVGTRDSEKWGRSLYRLPADEAKRITLASLKPMPEPRDVRVHFVGDAEHALRSLVGRDVSGPEAARAFGAIDGATVRVEGRGERVFAQVIHPDFKSHETFLGRDDQGALFLSLDRVESKSGGRGAGLRSFAAAVAGGRSLGVEYLDAFAEGRPGSRMNGYYVWPRLGFEAELTAAEIAVLPDELSGARTLNELHRKGGQEWWQANGSQRQMAFSLADDSEQLAALKFYLRRKGLRLE